MGRVSRVGVPDLTRRHVRAFHLMMEVVRIPPFERLYTQHAGELLGYLRRVAGPERAEDCFQETFLRALAAYPKLRSARNLRGWLFTIATRVAIDERRRRPPAAELPEIAVGDRRPAYAELEHLTDELPPTERAAVVLRYGYDLAYVDIAAALGSTEEAARQAASSGVRRLRGRSIA
jgi:RNA polymerase sigma factor (sigma-70 family)